MTTGRADQLLAAYDAQLRGEAEVAGAISSDRVGPLHRAVFGRRGFVSYESLADVDDVDRLITETVAHFAALQQVDEFEWKTRDHDRPAELGERLRRAGLVAEEPETVMIGEAAALAVDVELPEGVVVRRVDRLPDRERVVAQASRLQREVFGGGPGPSEVLERPDRSGGLEEFWIVDADGAVVCAGRLQRVAGTEFAGLWGGACGPGWRGRGLYRALTSARARSALRQGVRYLHSDCTAMSRPILQRSGLVAVTTTTPYLWRR